MISKEEVSFTFELPNFDELPDSVDREALVNDVGEFIAQSILDHVGAAKSPVAGGRYAAELSETYARTHKNGDTLANLDLNGDMLNSLEVVPDYDTGRISIGIFDADQAIKAYNHNIGDTLPQRQFIPDEDDLLQPSIIRGVKRIIQEYLEGVSDGEEE